MTRKYQYQPPLWPIYLGAGLALTYSLIFSGASSVAEAVGAMVGFGLALCIPVGIFYGIHSVVWTQRQSRRVMERKGR